MDYPTLTFEISIRDETGTVVNVHEIKLDKDATRMIEICGPWHNEVKKSILRHELAKTAFEIAYAAWKRMRQD